MSGQVNILEDKMLPLIIKSIVSADPAKLIIVTGDQIERAELARQCGDFVQLVNTEEAVRLMRSRENSVHLSPLNLWVDQRIDLRREQHAWFIHSLRMLRMLQTSVIFAGLSENIPEEIKYLSDVRVQILLNEYRIRIAH